MSRYPETFHIVPINDLREHDDSPECWCKPALDDETECIWVHNSMDKREFTFEQGWVQ